jgi:hypothetical protein
MEPGDVYYAEPYFYVNMYPFPSAHATTTLPAGGSWHIAANGLALLLPGSRLEREETARADHPLFLPRRSRTARERFAAEG